MDVIVAVQSIQCDFNISIVLILPNDSNVIGNTYRKNNGQIINGSKE